MPNDGDDLTAHFLDSTHLYQFSVATLWSVHQNVFLLLENGYRRGEKRIQGFGLFI